MNKFESMGTGVPPQETPKNEDENMIKQPDLKEENPSPQNKMSDLLKEQQTKKDQDKIAEIRASLGVENSEKNDSQFQKTVANADTLISDYKELTEEVRRTGKSSDPEYSSKRESMEEKMINQSAELSDKLGVNLRDVFVTDNEIFNNGREVVMLRRACGIAKEAEELGFSKEGDVKDLTDLAEKLIQDYDTFTEPVRRTGKSEVPDYSTRAEAKKLLIKSLSNEIADRLGVNLRDVFISDNEAFNKGLEKTKLNRAVGIAKEAEELGFSKEGTDEELIDEAKRLIDDYEIFTEPVRKTGKSEVPDYSSRREAKQILIESLARELATRMDSGDGIDVRSIRELSEKTGVDFSKAVRESYKLPPRKKEEKPEGRLPQIGASGIWRTSGGDVEGRVIAGKKGGPFTIETPRGKMQVDNIF